MRAIKAASSLWFGACVPLTRMLSLSLGVRNLAQIGLHLGPKSSN
jgi:hypothetical protein